jgi:uncharacterized protein YggL (DUF469 family)
VDAAAAGALRDDFLAGPVEGRGLVAEGSGDREWRQTISREGGQATEADREAVAAWAAARGEIAVYEIGPLVDLSGVA